MILIQVGSFDENATQFYSAEIIIALEYLHKKGIIHRSPCPHSNSISMLNIGEMH